MKRNLTVLMIGLLTMVACANKNKDYIVTIHTSFGDMKVILYDETPLHKENFIELAKTGQYDSTIFHRIIQEFMVQGGGIDMKNGTRDNKTIPAEIVSGMYHHKGALAAARQGDQVNPQKASSWCQFYIVQGKKYTEQELGNYEDQMNQGGKQRLFGEVIQQPKNADLLSAAQGFQKEGNRSKVDSIINLVMQQVDAVYEPKTLTDEQKEVYITQGGSPHLDNEYTVFGRVVEGMDIIDQLAAVKTGGGNKPVEDYFMTMEVEQVSKKKITKEYGYTYPEEK